jgi:hypothetical protein
MLPIKYDARSVQQELNTLSEQLRTLIKVVNTDEVQTNLINAKEQGHIHGKQQLVLNAGESSWYAAGQTDEYVYINAEKGIQVNSTNNNWNSGWGGRQTATLRGDLIVVQGDMKASNTIGNLDADADIGQQMELGNTTMTTLRFDADNWRLWAGGTGGGQELLKVTQGGNATLKGSLTENASDERLKENITLIPNALDKVGQLRGVTFDWVDDIEEKGLVPSARHETGVIAQDVQRVIPDAVAPAPFDEQVNEETGETESISGEDYLTVKPQKIIPLLIEAIKELKAEVEELKANQ